MVSRIFRPPLLDRVRLACVDDAPIVFNILSESMSKNFRIAGTSDIVYLIENGVLSICQLNIDEAIVGFLAARDYPLIPSVHPQAWEEYIWTKYKTIELNSRNTLFLHLLCWNPVYGRDCVDNMLKSIFMHDAYVHHIAMMKSLINYPCMLLTAILFELRCRKNKIHNYITVLVPGQFRSESSFRRVQAMERGMPGDKLPALCIADRQEVCPRLRIRRAVEEDNDDILPIIERHSTRLRQLYGEFYVSELISRHPESARVLLVCEHKELAVGVMCLNTQINYEALEESFELSPFAGLRHLDAAPYHKRSKDNVDSAVSLTGSNVNNATESGDIVSKSKESKSRVTWLFDEDEFKEFRVENGQTARSMTQLPPLAQLDVLHLLEDEEDELEFDIVNIDTDLLRVPQLLSYDALGRGPVESVMKLIDGSSRHGRKEPPGDDKTKRSQSKMAAISPFNVPEPIRYYGTPNAFLLELFAMHPDYDERYGFDMLEATYELFPDRDYCVMCLPSNHASFPLLEHFTLVTPYGCRLRFINDTLYVAHVNSVRGDLKVRPGEAVDIPALNDVLEHAPRAQALLDLFESSLTSCTLQNFVLLSQNQPIGLVVLGPLEDGTAIRTQYNLEPEPRRPGTDGTILAGVMSPAFEPHGRWYIRELLRHSQYSTLFWICRLFAKGDANPSRNLMSLAGHMTPVHPRLSVPNISGNSHLDQIFRDVATPFALWVLERPLSCLPKVYVNSSIVVVGASRTGLAFLETLLMGPTAPYLIFSNVTLISEHGLPTVTECLRAADTCVPRDGRYTDRYLKSVPFYFYLDVMSAVMTKIDRKKKCIHLKSGGEKYYDELVLTCGQQFQHPDYLSECLELVKEVEKGKPCDRTLMDDPSYRPDQVPPPPDIPDNVMLINSLFEANICLRKLMHMITEAKDSTDSLSEDNQVVVYGECIEAYSCIAALLELGLTPDRIAFVEPFPSEDGTTLRVNCFNDETVDERVQANLDKLGIRVLRQCSLVGWRQVGNRVEAVHLMSPLHAICLPCFALFFYGLKAIDIHAFRAINECGLVYDGGLVVGPKFDTNDPCIYGAGTCVRYSRRLYANRRLHGYYCSEDVGEALARLFLKKLDPFVMGDEEADGGSMDLLPRFSSSLLAFKGSHASLTNVTRISLGTLRKWQPVMKFESPIVQSATLPGPLYYMRLRRPGVDVPMEVQLSLPHQGHTLLTDKRGNYFRLQLNVLHCVEAATCLSKKYFSSEIFAQLYGKHEAFFNKLLTRYQMNKIDDLFEFFTQPWMSALYQETFVDLLRDINDQDVGTVYDLVKSRFALNEEGVKTSMALGMPSCCEVPSCGFQPKCVHHNDVIIVNGTKIIPLNNPVIYFFLKYLFLTGIKDAPNLGTFRSVIDKFVARTSSVQIECGQSASIRNEAAAFWRTVGGERIVMAHLERYLNRNFITNPHYAVPKRELI